MPQSDFFRRYLDAGLAIGQLTRARAEEIVRDLVKAGEVQREQTQQWVDDLVDRSRQNTELLVALVGSEVRKQLEASPLASRTDLAQVEKRLNDLAEQINRASAGPRLAVASVRERVERAVGAGRGRSATKKSASAPKATPATKVAAKKTAPARRTPAKKAAPTEAAAAAASGPDRTAPKKTTPKKTPAKKAAATKATGV